MVIFGMKIGALILLAHTDCIMGAWQSRIREGTTNPRTRIPMLQIANIKAIVERFAAEDDGGSPSHHS